MHLIVYFLMAVMAGLMLPVQAGLNSEMGRLVKSPVLAAIISFTTGLIALVLFAFVARIPLSNIKNGLTLPWYYWMGGVLGAFYVYALVALTPRLGVALVFGLTVAAQMAFSLVMDHYGWLGVPVATVSWQRILGVLFIVGGVVLIRTY